MADVLVVDDDAGVRRILCRTLRVQGHSVRVVCDAEEGLTLVQLRRPDIVITDLNLPGMKGDELIHRLREFPDCPAIIAMTGVPRALSVVEDVIDGSLVKPIDLDEVDRVVGRFAAN